MNQDRRKKVSNKVFYWTMTVGLGLSIVTFVMNWLILIHQGETTTSYRLFDISFYHFSPLLSWGVLTILAIRNVEWWESNKDGFKKKIIWLIGIIILLSPIVRAFDILVDFSIKYLLGMTQENPFSVLIDVWLVVIFSMPTAAFKMAVIAITIYAFTRRNYVSRTLALRAGDGSYHVVEKENIEYLQADGNYLIIQTSNDSLRTRITLKSVESKLGREFYRIHKSTIVNWKHIKQLKHWRNGEYLVVMNDDKPLTSSKSYKLSIDQIKDRLAVVNNSAHPNSATVRPSVV